MVYVIDSHYTLNDRSCAKCLVLLFQESFMKRTQCSVEILGKQEHMVHVTGLLRDLSLSVLLNSRNTSTSNKENNKKC